MNAASLHYDSAVDYMLGWMSPRQRARIQRRIETDPKLAKTVDELHSCLSPLNALCDPVTPPDEAWGTIVAGLAQSPRRSRKLSYAIIATGAALAALMLLFQIQPRVIYQADLRDNAQQIAMVEVTNYHDLIVSKLSLPVPDGKSFELWIIPAGGKPKSLGVLPDDKIYKVHSDASVDHATMAISLEPLGGSPTGSATGPVIVSGELHRL